MSVSYFFRNQSGVITDITSRVRLNTLDLTSNAEEATVATSEIVVDDPVGDLIIGGHRLIYATESSVSSSSNTLIWIGYTAERNIERGPFRNAAGRTWRVSVTDENTLLDRRILTAASAKRPAETDVARVQYCANISALIDDTQYLSTASPVAMDAVDYSGQKISDIINDCMQQSGKNAFVWRRQEATNPADPMGSVSLWYGFGSGTTYKSDARLSNVITEVNQTSVFGISEDTDLRRDPSRVYSGVYMQYDGGTVYEQRAINATNFAIGGRDTTSPAENVKSNAKATARAQRYLLTDMASEEDVITTTALAVPAASVNRFMAGMLIPITAVHLPGYSTPVSGRILNRNVKQVSPDFYDIRMEISVQPGVGGTGDNGTGGGGGGCAPGTSPTDFTVPHCDDALDKTPIVVTGTASTPTTFSPKGVTLYAGATYRLDWTITHATANFECNWTYLLGTNPGGAFNFAVNEAGHDPALGDGQDPYTLPTSTTQTGTSGGNACFYAVIPGTSGYFGCDVTGSKASVVVTYLSGSDPRFVGLPACS